LAIHNKEDHKLSVGLEKCTIILINDIRKIYINSFENIYILINVIREKAIHLKKAKSSTQ